MMEDSSPPTRSMWINARMRYRYYLDLTVPHLVPRWVFTLALALVYTTRVLIVQGWYIVTYALGIYLLNLFIAFLTPKIDPSFQAMEEENEEGPTLPTSSREEFRPFIRRLPEFKFWHSCSVAFSVALVCTFFEFLDVPVFWPILVLYFFVLFFVTMKKQIKHMVKYRYLPFTRGKTIYKGKDEKAAADTRTVTAELTSLGSAPSHFPSAPSPFPSAPSPFPNANTGASAGQSFPTPTFPTQS